MLAQLEIRRIELLTNNPTKIEAMSRGGVEVVQRSGVYGRVTHQNRRYLTAKATRAGHWLDQVLVPWLLPLVQIALSGSTWATVAVTLERYISVVRPRTVNN